MDLRLLSPHDMREAIRAHEELAREDFEFLIGYKSGMDWALFLKRTEAFRHGVGLSTTQVPATFLVAEVADRIVGRVSIRHHLNQSLERVGGHIGYAVRPGFREKGHAGQILDLALIRAKNLGISRALLTYDVDNFASRRLIESRGGIPVTVDQLSPRQNPKLRYWVPT